MENVGVNTVAKPPTGKMKARAPPPPQAPQPAPRRIFPETQPTAPESSEQGAGDLKENMLCPTVDILIILPDGIEKKSTVNGRKAVMDLLVDLCSQYHLSPAYHTLELQSGEAQPLAFKPNTLLGMLDVHTVLIKEKVVEEKPRRLPPKVPEKSVRLVVNYHRTQKAVLRVNPLVPLKSLIPLICEKCEFDPRHVILLRDNINNRELELSKSLNDLGIRELYLLDHSLVLLSKNHSSPVLNYGESGRTSSLSTSASEKKGLLGFFKLNRRKSKPEEQRAMDTDASDYGGYSTAPSTPAVNARPGTLGPSLSVGNIPRMSPKEDLKKRRAPPPPAGLSSLHSSQETVQVTPGSPNANQQKKRRAPPPPCTPVLSTKMEEKAPVINNQMEEAEPEINNKMEEAEPVMNNTAEQTESMRNCKVEETENNRRSTMGAGRQVPLKPRRGNVRDPPQLVLPPPPPYPPCLDMDFMDPQVFQPTDAELASQMDHQSWLRSMQDSHLEQNEMESQGLQELETVSMASSGSFRDNTRAASEGTAEDSGIVSSPSDIVHPTSPDGSLRVDQCSSEAGVPCHKDACLATTKDFSSDSEEGSTTWTLSSRHNSDMHPEESRGGNDVEQYDEDLYITTQLHQTLTDLEADLEEIEDVDCATEMSTFSKEKIEISYLGKESVSELEMTIPVTAIDEVCEEYRCSMTDYEVNKTKTEEETNTEKYLKSDLENKNNNAGTSDKEPTIRINHFDALISTDQLSPTTNTDCVNPHKVSSLKLKDQTQRKSDNHKDKIMLDSFKKTQMISTQQKTLNKETWGAANQSKNQAKATEFSEEDLGSNKHQEGPGKSHSSAKWTQTKIPHEFVSRVGMSNTFTVVPPKPAVKLYRKEGGSLVSGAIKIDAQGNLIQPGATNIVKHSSSGAGKDEEDSLLGKAKAFWNSAEQTELDTTNRVAITKHSVDPEASNPQHLEPGSKLRPPEEAKSVKPKELKEDFVRDCTEGDQKKPVIPGLTYQPPKSSLSSNIGAKADPSFLKPFRRTSSQYVASAITKYTGMPTPRAEPLHESAQNNCESIQENEIKMSKSTNFNQQSAIREDFPGASQYKHRESNSIKHIQAFSAISKAKEPGLTVSSVNRSRPLSFPNQYITPSQSTRPAFKESVSTEERTKSDMPNPIQSKAHTITVQENRKMKSFEFHPSPYPKSASPQSFVAPLKPDSSSYRSYRYPSISQTGLCAPHANIESVPQKTVMCLSEMSSTNVAEPSLQANAGIFGPIKKFKPVALKPVQKDTSLHSLLMESIQGSEGKEKLRKTSDATRNDTQKKPSFVEEENERSALLSAIRSQNGISRLRKTTSAASEELCAIKNISVTENHRNTEVVLFPPSFSPPPPPPSVLTKVYHSNPSANSNSNPEQTREALLKAICTGTGAAQLKKVPAPSKTVLVNGRLGTIHTSSIS
ncbi:protein cordon-bleu isoform X2 [Acipenser ruthenus]|uniref:protein cordon-bleu isoform X2 n=1 Tax=Acipenser ruthenus TaxID=7906 RepID=UPI002740B0D1|nr:protein cordon-bleu isoform X2 [Acipenser ruthenus]